MGLFRKKDPPRRVSQLPEASPGEQTGVSIGMSGVFGISPLPVSRNQ